MRGKSLTCRKAGKAGRSMTARELRSKTLTRWFVAGKSETCRASARPSHKQRDLTPNCGLVSVALLPRRGQAKPNPVGAKIRTAATAIRRTQQIRAKIPGTATQYPVSWIASGKPGAAIYGRSRVVPMVQIGAPLEDIPRHVVKAKCIGILAANCPGFAARVK